jgi:hypothetical protein
MGTRFDFIARAHLYRHWRSVQAVRLIGGGGRGIALLFHDHGTKRGERSASRPDRSLPPGKTRYPLYRRLGGPPGPVWTSAENLILTGIRSPDRPARNQSAILLQPTKNILNRTVFCYSNNVDDLSVSRLPTPTTTALAFWIVNPFRFFLFTFHILSGFYQIIICINFIICVNIFNHCS